MGNLTRAAEASHITVPAASRRLALLEHQFKATLFERHSRGLQLTPAGDHLLGMAREIIAGVQHMRAEMGNYASGRHAVLRIHGNTSAMTQFLPADVADFQAAHDKVRIVLEECWSDEALRRVRSGEADLGVVVEGCDTSGLWTRPYRHDRLAAVMHNDIAPQAQTVAFGDLLEHDLVGLEGSSTLTAPAHRAIGPAAAAHDAAMCRCAASRPCAARWKRGWASACCRWRRRAALRRPCSCVCCRCPTTGRGAACCWRCARSRPARRRWANWPRTWKPARPPKPKRIVSAQLGT